MSKTNKERLQDNNAELQNIKTEIDNLPDFGGDVKLFKTVEEMQEDENPHEEDLAVVYREELHNWDGTTAITQLTFPSTVVLTAQATGSCYGWGSGSSYLDIDGSVSSSSANFRLYTDNGSYRIQYTSSDGLTYTRTDSYDETIVVSDSPLSIRMMSWSDVCGNFMKIGGNYFEGLYTYVSTNVGYYNFTQSINDYILYDDRCIDMSSITLGKNVVAVVSSFQSTGKYTKKRT